jgi:hypothetical protein
MPAGLVVVGWPKGKHGPVRRRPGPSVSYDLIRNWRFQIDPHLPAMLIDVAPGRPDEISPESGDDVLDAGRTKCVKTFRQPSVLNSRVLVPVSKVAGRGPVGLFRRQCRQRVR